MLNWVDDTEDGIGYSPVPVIFVCDVCKKELEDPRYWMVQLLDNKAVRMMHKDCDDGSINCGWIEGCEFMESLFDRLKLLDAMYSIKEQMDEFFIPEEDLVDTPELVDEDEDEDYESDEDDAEW